MNRTFAVLMAGMALVTSACSSSSQADSVDANTKMLASNIIIDNSKTTLSATTLQSAIEELAPATLSSSVIVGSWNILNYPDKSTGSVTFNSDGTYSVTSGAFRVSGNLVDAPYTGKWKMIEGTLLELVPDVTDTYHGTTGNDSGVLDASSKYPSALVFTKSKIILKDASMVSILSPAK
ncbi:hypothetical protein [Geomonas azotofigens]|uniref:hypothetical protein n=1 Tax=Geomonas azotofigens TaxID=2843196 RepID=UPI001C1097D9|nr:hypothetical protein [Geomonas azotofigens]MBU5612626.1 hypothetical protein [Geomonas azotofigens]